MSTHLARLRLVRSDDPGALLEAAADGFLEARSGHATPFGSPPYLLLLRQGGLRDDLIRVAAERGVPGWFDPPVCLFQQLHEWLGSTDRVPCGDYERVVLLSRILREQASALIGRLRRSGTFVDAVDRVFGELVSEAVTPDAFASALEARPERDAFERDRDHDLAACYRAYVDTLATAGKRDGRDRLVDTALALAADSDALARRLGGRREIRILGLQDLRGGWRILLRALLASPALDDVVLYSATDLEPMLENPPGAVERTGADGGLAARLFAAADPAAGTAEPAVLLSAPDADRETEEVARRVRALLDAGTAPARVAVVARSARPYTDRVLDALALYGVPATARRRHAFAAIPVVRAVLALFAVAAEGWTRHGLVELAEQPYFGRLTADGTTAGRLDPVVINHIGYRRRVNGLEDWVQAHRALRDAAAERERRAERGDDEPRRAKDAPPPAYRCEAALASFTAFAEKARELDTARPVRAWVDWLRRFLDDDPWRIESRLFRVPAARYDLVRVDAAGLRGMRRIIAEWEAALAAWGEEDDELDAAGFEARLREMLSGDAALWTPARRGVQVLEGLAAAQRSFDHVFITGLSGDTFPLRAPRSPILDERDRRDLGAAGVPVETRAMWEDRERELFRVLVAGARRSLTLSWPRTDAEGRELAPSAFVEEVVLATGATDLDGAGVDFIPTSRVAAASLPLVRSAAAIDHAGHAARIERLRGTGVGSPWNGIIEDGELREWLVTERLGESYVWSATQLEAYAKCPWAWFSQRLLRLDDLDDPDIDMDPLVRGAVLHEALRLFYEAAATRLAGPVWLRPADLQWVPAAVEEALAQAIAAAGSAAWIGAPALRETKRAELARMLVRYIEWEIEHNEKHFNNRSPRSKVLRTGVHAHEFAFGSMSGPESASADEVLEFDGVTFRVRGSIDRVEIGIDDRIGEDARGFVAAVDYKSGKYSTPGAGHKDAWADRVVLQVPLYAHILERRMRGTRVSRVEYRAIKHREAVHSVDLVQVIRGRLESNEEAREQMELALEATGAHVRSARAGRFPADPAPSCGCPPFCHAWDICRVQGGPKTSGKPR